MNTVRVFRLALLLAALPSGVAAESVPARDPSAPPPTGVDVLYATNRAIVSRGARGPRYGERSSALTFGLARVTLPSRHVAGHLESPAWNIRDVIETPARHVVLAGSNDVTEREFLTNLAAQLRTSPGREVLVFIHGYNVTFNDAVRRAAQLKHDLNFQGPVVLFSWPANGDTEDYPADFADAQASTSELNALLQLIRSRSGARLVHAVAHSMGNEVLTKVLDDSGRLGIRLLDEVVLTAPDVDSRCFVERLPQMLKATGRLTLYASSSDRALHASRRIWQESRAGQAGSTLLVRPPVETVDASSLKTDFLGHSYYVAQPVLDDLVMVLRNRLPPSNRRLAPSVLNGARYWRFPRNR